MIKHGYFLAAIILTLAVTVISVAFYSRLPQLIPTHWNIHGNVNAYGDKEWALFLLPAIMILLTILFRALSWLSPRTFSIESFRPTFDLVMFLVVAFMAYIQMLVLWAAFHHDANMGRFFLAGIFLFFAAIGNVLGKVRRNFWLGVRTPWTLASERVWNDTHRFSARLFVVVGVLGFVISLAGGSPVICIALIMIATMASIVYSLLEYKWLEKRGEV